MSHFGGPYDDLIKALKDNTDRVSERIDKLTKALAPAMSDAQLAEITALSEHLKALGSDERQPVPMLAEAAPTPVVEHVLEAAPTPEAALAPVAPDAPTPVAPAAAETAPALDMAPDAQPYSGPVAALVTFGEQGTPDDADPETKSHVT